MIVKKSLGFVDVLLVCSTPFIFILGVLFLFMNIIMSVTVLYVISNAGIKIPEFYFFVFKFAPLFLFLLPFYLILMCYRCLGCKHD
jgi:hypothetical protein